MQVKSDQCGSLLRFAFHLSLNGSASPMTFVTSAPHVRCCRFDRQSNSLVSSGCGTGLVEPLLHQWLASPIQIPGFIPLTRQIVHGRQ
jgi:hypothetical protein